MKIIGIDPGLSCTGWGVIEKQNGKIHYIDSGHICTNSKNNVSQRLYVLHRELTTQLQEYKADVAAIEETFINNNPKSSLSLSHARGALLLTLAISGIVNINHYSANYIKKSVTGNGHANKEQVMEMVKLSIKKRGEINHNSADGLAAALCCAFQCNVC